MPKKPYPPIEPQSDSLKEPAPAAPTVFNPSQKVFRDMTPEQLYDVIAKEIDDIYAVG
ncbi:MAG: hypothetical protein J6T43_00185 [Prevotella sp.]|jgi:hypothetical protein|nr:hypothetical protein [Prevotella sp.]